MARIMASEELSADWQKQPPPMQLQLELPVLFNGHRPRKRRRRLYRNDPMSVPVQLTIHELLEQLRAEDEAADQAARAIDAIEGVVKEELWADDEVYMLHLGLLERSIEILADTRTSAATMAEILDWVRKPPNNNALGLSYRKCCELAGYDADELSEQLFYEVGRLHKIALV